MTAINRLEFLALLFIMYFVAILFSGMAPDLAGVIWLFALVGNVVLAYKRCLSMKVHGAWALTTLIPLMNLLFMLWPPSKEHTA